MTHVIRRKLNQVKGSVKEGFGKKLTGDTKTEAEGAVASKAKKLLKMQKKLLKELSCCGFHKDDK